MRPVLLLDVDGVLCPFGVPQSEAGVPDPEWEYNERARVFVCKKNQERLKQLQRTFELHWATAWEDRANELLLEVHGLKDPLPIIEFSNFEVPGVLDHGLTTPIGVGTWKLPWIKAWADDNERPFAWVDDDILSDTVEWAEARTEAGTPTLALPIDPNIGLDDSHVQKLEDWWDLHTLHSDLGED